MKGKNMITDNLESVKINIGGKEYLITPLSAKDFGRVVPQGLSAPNDATCTPAEYVTKIIDILIKIVHAALLPLYPDMTLDQVRKILHFDKEQSLMTNGEQIANAITAANVTVQTILKISSFTWEWNPQITKH